jgi:hypothetical protein
MSAFPRTNELWWQIVGDLCDVAEWFAGGELTPDEYRKCVTTFEAKKMERFGFDLRSAIADNGDVHFSLFLATTGELWLSVEINPNTGEVVFG